MQYVVNVFILGKSIIEAMVCLSFVSVMLFFASGTCKMKSAFRFGTKTAYEISEAFLHESRVTNSNQPHYNSAIRTDFNEPTTYTVSSWPKFCTPVQLNGLIRHGIRNAGQKDINNFVSAVNKLAPAVEDTDRRLFDSLIRMRDVITSYEPDSLMPQGRDEQSQLAQRLYRTYSDLLNKTDIEDIRVLVSSSQRTVDSSVSFTEQWLREMNYVEHRPNIHVNDSLLRFFDACDKYVKTVDEDDKNSLQEYYKYQKENFPRIIEKIHAKLIGSQELSQKELKALYIVSAIEVAVLKTSDILTLFDEEDITILEYATDLKNYWKKSYGHEINYKPSCILLADIFQHLENAVQRKSSQKAVLRFGHAETLLPLLALLGLYKDEPKLRAGNHNMHINRQFQTTEISPFSANLFFVLFECDENETDGNPWNKHTVQVLVNEMSVVIPGCRQEVCSFEELQQHYHHVLYSCDFEQICEFNKHEEL